MAQEIIKCSKEKHRTEKEKDRLIKRLRIIEGQVRGVNQMIEKDRYCDEILIQISAIDQSLKSIGKEIIKNHLETCTKNDFINKKENTIEDIMDLFSRL